MDGNVAIVTGGGSGVGACVARRLHELGWRVVLVGRREATLRAVGSGLGAEYEAWIAVGADVTDDGDRARIVEATLGAFGRIDALVNNAGMAGFRTLREHAIGEIEATFAVNATGPIDLAARCVRAMADGGAVVFTSSMASKDPFPGLGVYGCAKAAVNAACRAIANEEPGVRAYAVAPGAIETGMLRGLIDEATLPTARTLDPDEVAGVIVGCVTGETGAVSGETVWLPSP